MTADTYTARVTLTDTTDEARRRQLESYSSMPGGDKIMLAAEMAEQAKAIAIDGIRSRHPTMDEPGIQAAWLHLLHGELASRLSSQLS